MNTRFNYRETSEGHGVFDSQTQLTVAMGRVQPVAELLADLLNQCPVLLVEKALAAFEDK